MAERGGILNSGTLTITHSTFAYNGAGGAGGIGNSGTGTLTITNSTLAYNQGDFAAGGIGNSGTLALTNSTIAHNRGIFDGGGIYNNGTLTITKSTIADNESDGFAAVGSGLSNDGGSVVLQNTILARNILRELGQPSDCGGVVTSRDHNLISDPIGCTITFLPHDLQGEPGLGEFTDDGTPGEGHIPLVGMSRAIDAGNDATCPKTDQLGEKCVETCDIGAIEFQRHGRE